MRKRYILNSPGLLELKKRRRRIFLYKIFISLFLIAVILGSIVFISRDSNLNINKIEINGNKAIETKLIKEIVDKELAGNYFWFFPKTNFLFYPQNIIKTNLENSFKRIKDISVGVKNIKTLEISLTEREALYTWCGNVKEDLISSDKKCYFVDESGYIFDEAPYFSGEVYFKFYGPVDNENYFSKENFKQLVDFKDVLGTMGFKPISLYILNNGDVKIFLSVKNKISKEPYLIFKIDSDFKNVAENLESAISTEPLLSNLKNKYTLLQYIDLRFGNKVYYKFTR